MGVGRCPIEWEWVGAQSNATADIALSPNFPLAMQTNKFCNYSVLLYFASSQAEVIHSDTLLSRNDVAINLFFVYHICVP